MSSSLNSPALEKLADLAADDRAVLAGQCPSLQACLKRVPDPRDPRGVRHTLTALVTAACGDVQSVTITAANVGLARRAGACAALGGAGPAGGLWLASTDADSEVPVNWLTSMMAEARRGAHVVLGTVTPGPGLHPATRAHWVSQHHLRAGHPHVHGANFGIRGDAYLALGGWRPLLTGEDADLARRAAHAGHLRVSRIASAPVVTSVRREGRAPRGFSSYLRALSTVSACDELVRPHQLREGLPAWG